MNQYYQDMVYLSANPVRARIKLIWRCYRYYRGDWDSMLTVDKINIGEMTKMALSNRDTINQIAENIQSNNALYNRLKEKRYG